MTERPFRFSASADHSLDGRAFRDWCRRVEAAGCAGLTVPDHFGRQLALIPALAAAAGATSDLRIGALVACNDYRHPVMYAKEVATLDVLSDGRVDWGIGAGWLKPEYEQAGLAFDAPGVRIARMFEAVTLMKALFSDEPCTFEGKYYRVRDLEGTPKPVQRPHPRLLIGGQGRRILSFAAREADVVGIAPSFSSRQLGPYPPRQSVEAAADEQVRWIDAAAGARRDHLDLHMVAFPTIVTADRERAAERVAGNFGLSPEELLRSPHALIGSVDQICAQLEHRRDRWGVSQWTVPGNALPSMTPVVERLSGT